MSVEEHKARGERLGSLKSTVITVSDTRTLETDTSGQAIVAALEKAGHEVVERTVVPDDPPKVERVLKYWLAADVQIVVLNGGTGIAPRDGTVEVVSAALDRELPGFGELFRYLSYKQIGSAAMLSRAVGGIASGKVVFSLPGSRKAVRLAMEKLILPELDHLVSQLRGS
jgi:molybdenum cofactor biosynthesis protein B